jgi:3-oxoacyl-[acyl-carrier-protein] synthase II
MRRRIVVTGVGAVNPLGHDVESMWSACKEGKSGVAYTTIFDASKFPTKISSEVKNWDITQLGEDPEIWKYRGRHTKFACGAAKQAVQASGIMDAKVEPTRFGVYLGCGEGSQDFDAFSRMMVAALTPDGLDLVKFTKVGLESLNPLVEIEQEPNMPAGTWPACSTRKAPTPTASRPVPPAARRSARPLRSFAVGTPT